MLDLTDAILSTFRIADDENLILTVWDGEDAKLC